MDLSKMKPTEIELCISEAAVLKSLNHPNILKFIDDFKIENDNERLFFLVTEIVNGGDLHDLIQKQTGMPTGRFPLLWVADMTGQVTAAMAYCHSQKVLHRDLKVCQQS